MAKKTDKIFGTNTSVFVFPSQRLQQRDDKPNKPDNHRPGGDKHPPRWRPSLIKFGAVHVTPAWVTRQILPTAAPRSAFIVNEWFPSARRPL